MHCRVTNNSCRSRPCTSNIAIQQNTVAKPPPLLDRNISSGLRTPLTDMSATVETMYARSRGNASFDKTPRKEKSVKVSQPYFAKVQLRASFGSSSITPRQGTARYLLVIPRKKGVDMGDRRVARELQGVKSRQQARRQAGRREHARANVV